MSKTCNEFIKEFAEAGFDFTFTATNGELTIKGKCENGVIQSKRELTKEQLKAKLNANGIKT